MPVPAVHPSVIEEITEYSSEQGGFDRVATRQSDTRAGNLPVDRLYVANAVAHTLNQVNIYEPRQYNTRSIAAQGLLNMRKFLSSGDVGVVQDRRVAARRVR